ncbi:DUF3140 domain-containing protein [Streptomyces somaliensis]|uniref:DUF3140 domain-containing protein n=1 Tax=Streptomyces somaliensis TaxID=78355 RepID=UPI0020CC617C|nr:DUF3140 domain-containing protein [Streptomyces somaliensis]MCP9946991.1 DUF3140 domain-containing protein [Streptomyces somaliensis]MCP9963628.1 DUF3140 domain-containing protein [Streptomyces somaliensis]MCP9972844.1 DUF3140 domain-containing protein [Streptomyces somaliensis]MCP9976048.1 DUF3140 domain-containing protein [Streptomyces somaliensis]
MAASDQISAELWDEFHAVVNMTSRELQEWLSTQAAGEETEELPDRAGPRTGRRVLEILGKRRTDLTEDDIAVMRRVCEVVRSQRDADLEPEAGGTDWRHGLMDIGHDPLKPV